MLATEPTTTSTTPPSADHPWLENWSANERMRHIPAIAWMAEKLDHDLRRRIDLLYASYTNVPPDHPAHASAEESLRSLCRCIDTLAEIAKHTRPSHPSNDLGHRLSTTITHAVSCLQMVDQATFGHRYPVQTHERSKAEPLYGALLRVLDKVHRLTEELRTVDHGLDERLLEGLVVLANPVDARMLQPIA